MQLPFFCRWISLQDPHHTSMQLQKIQPHHTSMQLQKIQPHHTSMQLQKIQPQDAFILNICNPHEMHSFLWSIFMRRSPFPCIGTFSPVNRADRLADRSDECLLLLGQYVWSNSGNIAPSVDSEMTSVPPHFLQHMDFLLHAQHLFQFRPRFALVVSLILLWLDCSEGVYPCCLVSGSFSWCAQFHHNSNRWTASVIEKISGSFFW